MEGFDDSTGVNLNEENDMVEENIIDDLENDETTIDIDESVTDTGDIKNDNQIEEDVYIDDAEAGHEIDIEDVQNEEKIDIEENNVENVEQNSINEQNELQEYIEKESPYSQEVNEYIFSKEELELYKESGLVERDVDGRTCLIREDLDLSYIDKESGLTNEELIAKGRSPYDAKTGERIELHHIGQDFNAPFAELKSVSEHDLYSKTLHKSEMDSWRRDPEKVSEYSAQRKAHWKSRK